MFSGWSNVGHRRWIFAAAADDDGSGSTEATHGDRQRDDDAAGDEQRQGVKEDDVHPRPNHRLDVAAAVRRRQLVHPAVAENREAVDPEVVHGYDEDSDHDADQYNTGHASRTERRDDF